MPDLVRSIGVDEPVDVIPAPDDDALIAALFAAEERAAPQTAPLPDAWAVRATDPEGGRFLISSANPLPTNGQEGDVLIMRDGRAQWVSPVEAFRPQYANHPGTPGGLAELQIVARQQAPSHSIPRPPEPPPPPKKHRTAWAVIMDDDDA